MSSAVRVVLLRPNCYGDVGPLKVWECMGLGYLASALRSDGHEVIILDGELNRWTESQTAKAVLDCRPEIIGVTNILASFPDDLIWLMGLIREGGHRGLLLVGGHSVSFFPDRILQAVPEIDAVVCGEGDQSIRSIAGAVARRADWRTSPGIWYRENASIRMNPVRRIENLDLLPWPARDLTKQIVAVNGVVCLSSSRGCYAHCSFCSIPRFYGLEKGRTHACGFRAERSASNVAREILDLHEKHSVSEVVFVDEEFFGPSPSSHRRVLELAHLLKERESPVRFGVAIRAENANERILEQLRDAGMAHVFIGIESGLPEDLRLYGKNHTVEQNARAIRIVKSLGLSFQIGFMFLNFDSTVHKLRRNVEFLKSLDEYRFLTLATEHEPYFGAPIIDDMRHRGNLVDKGLELSFKCTDTSVETIRAVIDECERVYVPYAYLLATLQAAVTFRWRRKVPGRSPETERAINEFENLVDLGTCAIVEWAIEEMDRRPTPPKEEIVGEAKRRVSALSRRLSFAKALLDMHIIGREERR